MARTEPTARRQITIGDVLRAFRELGATGDAERRAIARLLGYDLFEGEAAGAPAAIAPTPLPVPPPAAPALPPVPVPADAPAGADDPPTELVRLPGIRRNDVELPAPLPRPSAVPRRAPVAPPLFAAAWSPAIVARLGARMAPAGALDLPRLIHRVARGMPIKSIPRRLRLVTAPRIVVVLDTSGGMPWLADDQTELTAQFRATLRAPIEVVTCDGPPAVAEAGAAGARSAGVDADATHADNADDAGNANDADLADDGTGGSARPVVRVEPGTRVLAVTELGAGSPWSPPPRGRAAAWHRFARDLGAQGASLVVLTPVPDERRPDELRTLHCIHWDPRTRPSQAHALVRQLR